MNDEEGWIREEGWERREERRGRFDEEEIGRAGGSKVSLSVSVL